MQAAHAKLCKERDDHAASARAALAESVALEEKLSRLAADSASRDELASLQVLLSSHASGPFSGKRCHVCC
jgi:hypothetical protein